jgi:heme/copper-type cytochrome/quinol oxidase subunit 2
MEFRGAARLVLAGVVVGAAALVATVLGGTSAPVVRLRAQDQAPVQRDVAVTAKKYAFEPGRIEVNQNDLVRVTLRSGDIPHSFTVDSYRIAKRVGTGQTVTFEFRADQAGTFPIYCNLRQEDGCRNMRGELVVHAR